MLRDKNLLFEAFTDPQEHDRYLPLLCSLYILDSEVDLSAGSGTNCLGLNMDSAYFSLPVVFYFPNLKNGNIYSDFVLGLI